MFKQLLTFCRSATALGTAAILLVMCGFYPNTVAVATNTLPDAAAMTSFLTRKGHVLDEADTAAYRAAFAAEERRDRAAADAALNRVSDRRLVGHVLAERYAKSAPTFAELQTWLASYRDLPQAAALYARAKRMPEAKTAKLTTPAMTARTVLRPYAALNPATSGFRGERKGRSGITARRVENLLKQGEPEDAKSILEKAVQDGHISEGALTDLQARIALMYLGAGQAQAARRLTDASYMQDTDHGLWINGLSAYKLGSHAAAADAFTALASRDHSAAADHAAAAFWAYRSLKKTGETKEAQRWLQEAAASGRTFYGLLAASLLGQRNAADSSPVFDRNNAEILATKVGGARAMALAQIGRLDLAEAEIRQVDIKNHKKLQRAVLAFADTLRLPSLALGLGGVAVNDKGRPYDAALYPLPPWQPQGGFRVERALIYALARQESRFDAKAVSQQGACGLMQLMPSTAAHMGGYSLKGSDECPRKFMDPAVNLGLGQAYVRHLAGQPMIGDNLVLLLAAYNAGPGRLAQRTEIDAHHDPLLFIESLPLRETHDYVQQVLVQYWGYRDRLGQPVTSMAELARGDWPRFALRDIGKPLQQAANDGATSHSAVR